MPEECCVCMVPASRNDCLTVQRQNARQYLSNGLICARKLTSRERSVAEPKGPGGVSKALNAAWIRPFLFLIFIVVAWDLTIRLFRIPPIKSRRPAMSSRCCGTTGRN